MAHLWYCKPWKVCLHIPRTVLIFDEGVLRLLKMRMNDHTDASYRSLLINTANTKSQCRHNKTEHVLSRLSNLLGVFQLMSMLIINTVTKADIYREIAGFCRFTVQNNSSPLSLVRFVRLYLCTTTPSIVCKQNRRTRVNCWVPFFDRCLSKLSIKGCVLNDIRRLNNNCVSAIRGGCNWKGHDKAVAISFERKSAQPSLFQLMTFVALLFVFSCKWSKLKPVRNDSRQFKTRYCLKSVVITSHTLCYLSYKCFLVEGTKSMNSFYIRAWYL